MRVAIGAGTVQANQKNKDQEMNGADQRGVERRIRRIRGQSTRQKEHVYRKKQDVAQHHEGCGSGGEFYLVAVPPAARAVEQADGCDDGSEEVDLPSADECENCGEQQKKK